MENLIKPNQKGTQNNEHILPQTPNVEWQKMLDSTSGIKGRQERVNQNIEKRTALGGACLSRAKNSSLLNNPFENKEKFSNGSYAK